MTTACGGAAASSGGDESTATVDKAAVGRAAPDFVVPAVANGSGKVTLRNLRGKVVLVDFWATFCEPCRKSFPALEALYARHSTEGLRVVGISEDEAEDTGKIPDFAGTYGAKFAIGWDKSKAVARSYQPETMPSSFLIDRKGVVRYAHAGYHEGEENDLENEIETLLRE